MAAWPCALEDTTTYKLRAAEQAGEISADEALMYRYMALYAATENYVPDTYRGEWYSAEHWACGTPVVTELRERWPYMDPAVKAKLCEFCGFEDAGMDGFQVKRRTSWGDSSYGGVPIHTYDTPEGNYKVHYVLSGSNALEDPSDSNNNGIPDCVEWIGADLEKAFAQYVADGWYYHPDPEDQQYFPLRDRYEELDWPAEGNDYGGDDRWDAYLGKLSGGVGGVAYSDMPFPYTTRQDYSGYMNLRNVYVKGEGGSFGEPVISSHEFMHVTQFMYDVTTPSWYLEASAMWAEDTVYPNAGDPRGRMNSYLGNTLRSIDGTDDGGYIACIINFFFEDWCWRVWTPPEWLEVEGDLMPREVWRALCKGDQWYTNDPLVDRSPWDAIDYIIRYYHVGRSYIPGRAYTEEFETWNTWNWFTDSRDDRQHYRWEYGPVGLQNQWGSGEYPIVNYEPSESYYMNHLGHGFYYFTGLPSWPAAVFSFEGAPENMKESKDWGGIVMASKNGTTWTDLNGTAGVGTSMCSPADRGIVQVRNPGQYDAIVMIINNVATQGSELPFSYSVTMTDDTDPPAVSLAVVRPQGNPDYIELLLGADEDLFGAPEAGAYFTPNRGEERAAAVEFSGDGMSFIGSLVLEPGENGTGRFEWRAADTSGNIKSGVKNFSAGFLAAGGGTVGDREAALKLPAGAVREPVMFSIFPGVERNAPANAAVLVASGKESTETLGPAYDIGPSWAPLTKPVQVTLSYDGLAVGREECLSVFRWTGSAWEDLGGVIDKRGRRVTAAADRLGRFVLGYGAEKGSTPPSGKPLAFHLYQSFPNPARHETVISYTLPGATGVELAVYDLTGRRVSTVVEGPRNAGVHEEHVALTDDAGRPLPAGVYLYRLTAGSDAATRKFVIAD
jgi:hypothetical protein